MQETDFTVFSLVYSTVTPCAKKVAKGMSSDDLPVIFGGPSFLFTSSVASPSAMGNVVSCLAGLEHAVSSATKSSRRYFTGRDGERLTTPSSATAEARRTGCGKVAGGEGGGSSRWDAPEQFAAAHGSALRLLGFDCSSRHGGHDRNWIRVGGDIDALTGL